MVLDPTQPIDYDALDLPEARPPLDADPARWLAGSWTSKREQIRWEPGTDPSVDALMQIGTLLPSPLCRTTKMLLQQACIHAVA